MNNITKEIYQIIGEVFDLKNDAITPEMSWSSNDVDSFALVELIVAVQEHFHINFASDELGKLSTVADLVGMIESKVSARQ